MFFYAVSVIDPQMFHHSSNQAVSSCGISKTHPDDSPESQGAAGTKCLEQAGDDGVAAGS